MRRACRLRWPEGRGWRRLCILLGLAEAAGLSGLRAALPMARSACFLLSAAGDELVAESNVKHSPAHAAEPPASAAARQHALGLVHSLGTRRGENH
jgi:hypothetical protein